MPSEHPEVSPIFECRQCGECCKGFGGTYVTPEDIRRIAAFIGETPEAFQEKFCQRSGSRFVLAVGKNGYCVFMKDKRCGIHPVKPRMCRAWPFIEAVLKDPENWRIMAGSCPGMRKDASDGEILSEVRRMTEPQRNR